MKTRHSVMPLGSEGQRELGSSRHAALQGHSAEVHMAWEGGEGGTYRKGRGEVLEAWRPTLPVPPRPDTTAATLSTPMMGLGKDRHSWFDGFRSMKPRETVSRCFWGESLQSHEASSRGDAGHSCSHSATTLSASAHPSTQWTAERNDSKHLPHL